MSEHESNPFASPGSFTPPAEEELIQPLWPLQATDQATIVEIRQQDRGQIFNFRHRIMINIVGLSPAIFFFGGLGLMAIGGWNLPKDPMQDGFGPVWTLPLLAVGLVSAIFGGVLSTYYQLLPEDLYTYGKVCRNFALRPDALVQARDDHTFIGITPRENWTVIKLDTASDVGLLKIDRDRRTIYIEGDHHRYTIPAASLLDCEAECFYHPLDKATQHWLIRLVVQTENEPREILFGLSHVSLGQPRWNTRRQQLAELVVQRLLALRESPYLADETA